MKKNYIKDLLAMQGGPSVELYAFVSGRHQLKNLQFIDVYDSTGKMQILVKGGTSIPKFNVGAAIRATGPLVKGKNGANQIDAGKIELIGDYKSNINPFQLKDMDPTSAKYSDLIFGNRHLFVRQPKIADTLSVRHHIVGALHEWFREQHCTLP